MAWRIQDHVLRGEIDNRDKGVVCGRLWVHGIDQPVVLNLTGNAHPDLAGCLLTFRNPKETFPIQVEEGFHPVQSGKAGDLTASRKVRIVDDELDLADEDSMAPGQMANCLYLEWFSEANGRVVIESPEFELEVSPPAWTMTQEENEQRAEQAAANFAAFVEKLNSAVEAARHDPPEDKEWDEFDYELMMRESDAKTAKYIELLEKYGDSPEAEEIISKEMGWEDLSDDAEDDDEEAEAFDLPATAGVDDDEDEALLPEPHTEGIDWIRTKDGDIRHPLQHKCAEAAMRLRHEWNALGKEKSEDQELCELLAEFQITSGKLAAALNSLAYGRDLQEGPFVVACLKRALGHLHKTQAALESVTPSKLLPSQSIERIRSELFSIREDILGLMDEFRGRRK